MAHNAPPQTWTKVVKSQLYKAMPRHSFCDDGILGTMQEKLGWRMWIGEEWGVMKICVQELILNQ